MRKYLFLISLFLLNVLQADIPKKIHFIWLGSEKLDHTAQKRIKNWMKYHPEFQFYLWTDQKHDLSIDNLEIKSVDIKNFPQIEREYNLSQNFGERAHLLKFAILENYGGIYAEADCQINRSIAPFIKDPFFIGLAKESIPIIGTYSHVGQHILGSEANHPLLNQVLEQIKQDYDRIGASFVSDSEDSLIYRLYYRTLKPLNDQVIYMYRQQKDLVKIYPANYFNAVENKQGIYLDHLHEGKWQAQESEFDRFLKNNILRIEKKIHKAFYAVSFLGIVLLMGPIIHIWKSIRKIQL